MLRSHSDNRFCPPPPNGSLRHWKGTLASFPPKKALVWEGFCGDLNSDFLGNLLWAIFSDQDKSAESCLFSFWSRGRWRLMCVFESYGRTTTAGNWPHIPNPQLKLHPSLSLFLSPPFIPPCCLPSTPLCSIISLSNGFWVDPKKPIALDEYHLFALFFL